MSDSTETYLDAAGVFFSKDDDVDDRMLNLNDTFAWGCSDGEIVSDDDLPEVERLHWRYGWYGLLYWVATKRGMDLHFMYFQDVQRGVQFVASEEGIRSRCVSDSEYAFLKVVYTIGQPAKEDDGE